MASSNSDRQDALEPIYSINGWAGSTPSLRNGVRNRDRLPVIIKILINLGTEYCEGLVHRYFKSLMGEDELIVDVLTRGDDLYLVYRAVGHYDGTSLLTKSLTPESFIRRVKLAQQAMNHWHQYNLAHGALTLSKIRFSKNWQKAWLTDPDLRFLRESNLQPNIYHDYRNFIKIFHRILKFIDDPDGIAARFLLNLKPQITATRSKLAQKSDFYWPPEVYGRNELCEELRDSLITTGKQRIMIVGEPGIGKTTLLEALSHDLQLEDAWVVVTRFTQDGDSTAAVAEAFESIGEQILFSEPLLARRKAIQLRKAVGYAASLVAEIAPSFAVLWHEVNDRKDADKHANPKKILRLALARLLKYLTENNQLILLVEDAHLAGRSGKKLLRGLDLEQISLNIVGFARPAEQLKAFKHFKTIHLGGISCEDFAGLLNQITGIPLEDLKKLVDKLYLHFNGNPLHLRMALSALIDKKALWKSNEGIWQYDINKVEPVLLGMQPGEIIQARLALFDDPKQIFKILAVLEPPFTISLAASATGLTKGEITHFFRRAISAQLLKESGEAIIHDNVRQSLLKNLTREEEAKLNWQIGQRLYASPTDYKDTAKYLAKGVSYAETHSLEMGNIIPRILESLDKAINLGYIEDAELYSKVVSYALESGNIISDLEVKARVCLARVHILARSYQNAQHILATTVSKIGKKGAVALTAEQVHIFTLLGESDRALTTGLQALKALGINLNTGSAALQEIKELLEQVQQLLGKRVVFKRARRDFDHALQQLLASLLPLTYVSRADLFPGVVSQLVKQTIKHGITPDSVRGFTTLGQLACTSFNNAKLGMILGREAERIATKPGLSRYLPIVYSDLANFILPWSGNLLEVNTMNRRGMVAADELGEVQYSGYIRMHDVINRFAGGDRLPGLLKRVNSYINKVRRDKNALAIAMLEEASIGMRSILAAELIDYEHDDIVDAAPLTKVIHGLIRAYDFLLREQTRQADVHLQYAEKNLPAADGWLAPKILYIQLKSLFIVRSSGDSETIYDMLAEMDRLQLTTQTLQPVVDYLSCLLSIKKKNTWDAIRFAEIMLEEAESLGYRALAALCAEETSRFLALQGRESLSVSFQRRAAKFYHDWGLGWKAGRLGYGLELTVPRRTWYYPESLADWRPGLSGQSAITQVMIWLRDRVGASRVILAAYKQGVIELALQLKESEETLQNCQDNIFTLPRGMTKLLNKAMNTGKAECNKLMIAMPLSLGVKRFVVATDGAPPDFLKTVLSNGAERFISAALFDYIQRQETPSIRSLLQLLMTHLGDFYFLVDVEGNGIDLDGKKFPVPKTLRVATENIESSGNAEITNELWTPPESETGYYRFTGLPTGNIEWLNWDVACVLWVAKDMTDESLQAKNEAAIQEAELVKRLAAGLNHDMNNYLTAISGYVEMLSFKGKVDLSEGSLKEAVEGLRAISRRFYHLSQGQVSHIKPQSINLVPIVKGAGRYLKWLVPENCTFEIVVPDHPVYAVADVGAIDRILLNLVTNAKQALGEYDNYIGVKLVDAKKPAIEVEDNGSGIAPDQLESIFRPGFSGKGSSGLGLHIVKTEANAMSANISVQSTPGVGTVMRICFPASTPSDQTD